tara:strand:+ start:90 stop:266 length:177 start_codon:yes stop_codon:yes gene_type:complete
MSDSYVKYYHDFIDCDWCGMMTRGRIYKEEPAHVRCGACDRELKKIDKKEIKEKEKLH